MQTENMPKNVAEFWDAFIASRKQDPAPKLCEAFYFCDNERDANALAELVVAGTKCATASLLWWYEKDELPLPETGELNIVTDWNGVPRCVIENTAIDIHAFEEVSAEFAATEGEGDKSLAYWRKEHWAFFSRECREFNRAPSMQMPVVCMRFRVIYPLPAA